MTSPLFDRAFSLVIGSEGGYVNDPKDPGGETKYGISKRAYPNEDIASMSLDRARELYWQDYWVKSSLEGLEWCYAYPLFDIAVNQGVGKAAKLKKEAGPMGPGFLNVLTALRILDYTALSTFPRYGKGWVLRAVRVMATSLTG